MESALVAAGRQCRRPPYKKIEIEKETSHNFTKKNICMRYQPATWHLYYNCISLGTEDEQTIGSLLPTCHCRRYSDECSIIDSTSQLELFNLSLQN